MAFHLGCMRALHDRDLLRRIKVVSGISGGSVLAAMWTYGPADFETFDEMSVDTLRRGLQRPLVRRVIGPISIAKSATSAVAVAARRRARQSSFPLRRHNRTARFVDALRSEVFDDKLMPQTTHPGLSVVLTATDLRSGGAVRFGSDTSSTSRYGDILDDIEVATAVGASAAYPLLLPALEKEYTFQRNGKRRREPMLLSDGGIYDNLGLSVLAPGRSPGFTSHVYNPSYILSCDAGCRDTPKTPRFWLARTARAFEIVHRRSQDHGRARLHEWQASRHIRGFVMSYLAMDDNRLPTPVADLIPREAVAGYPTNFAAMTAGQISALATRGEQLTRALLPVYAPDLA
jgi:predicted acylesterase/phospholipase RssA